MPNGDSNEDLQLKDRIKNLETKVDQLNEMYIKEKNEKQKLIKEITLERNQWNRERATLLDLNSKLTKMIEQINVKINSVKNHNE